MGAVLARCPLYALMFNCLAGCALIGPAAVENGRNTYNEAVASTARQQTLINIVRVHRNENPVFVDIPEIDASSQLQLNGTSAVTNLGSHAGTLGGASGRQGRRFRRGDPVSRSSDDTLPARPGAGAVHANLGAHYGRHPVGALWVRLGVRPHLRICFDQWVPSYTDAAAALNILIWLNSCGAIEVAATRSGFSAEKAPAQHVAAPWRIR